MPFAAVLLNQILRVRKFAVVQVHVALGRRDVRVSEQTAGELDPLLPADLRSAIVAGEVEDQIAGQAGFVAQSRIRPAEVCDPPCVPRRRQEDRPSMRGPIA